MNPRHKTLFSLAFLLVASSAWATPSTTYWAPSTALCQALGVPHVTYDNYFGRNAAYPNDVGLTMGVLPWEKIQAEVGLDLLYPSSDPLYLNAKLCTPEGSIFGGSPALSMGIYNVGLRPGVTDYNVAHFMAQKSLPWGGYVSAGVYYGINRALLAASSGEVNQMGGLAAVTSPDIEVGRTGLKKINFVADIQTGKNVLGAWGVGANAYFSDNVSLLTGPVFFFDKNLQPGGNDFLWTLQLDIDVSLDKPASKK